MAAKFTLFMQRKMLVRTYFSVTVSYDLENFITSVLGIERYKRIVHLRSGVGGCVRYLLDFVD